VATRDLEIRRLDAVNVEATIACVARLYPEGNVIARALGFTEAEYRPIAARTVRATLAIDMGLVVVDPADEAIVGFYFARDLVDQLAALQALAADDDPRLRAWGDLLGRLMARHAEAYGDAPARGEVLYMNIMALDERARGRGLMHALTLQASVEFGVGRGYRAIVGVATHPRSQVYTSGTRSQWSASLPFAELADPRLQAIPGAAEIRRYDLDPDVAFDPGLYFAPRPQG